MHASFPESPATNVRAGLIPSAVRTVRFLNDFLDDGGPLANFGGAEPLAPDA